MLDRIGAYVVKFGGRAGVALALMALIVGLSACGKKPGHVDPPVGVDKSTFPRVYPDAALDPSLKNTATPP